MRREDAAGVLGVAVDAGPDEVRAAFRARVRSSHPDTAGRRRGRQVDDLVAARRALLTPDPEPSPPPPPGPGRPVIPIDPRVDGDTLMIRDDPATVVARLVDAGHALGEITYLDRSSGLVEVLLLVQEDDDPAPAACSLVASLQGRMDGVEVFCTVERLDGHPAPPVAPIVAALAEELLSSESSPGGSLSSSN